jgi:formylglycine-generating enzyme required for sulfatase activity
MNSGDRAWPVGIKKPNDLGLFDMHGNAYNWCQDRYLGDYPKAKNAGVLEDTEDIYSINSQDNRVMRGGSFLNHASYVRSAVHGWDVPTFYGDHLGFRPSRTYRRVRAASISSLMMT